MTIKNADMPAMPTTIKEEAEIEGAPIMPNGEKQKYTADVNCPGLTKREMFAKDSNVLEQYSSIDNYPDMAEILGEKYEKSMTEVKRLELEFRFMAKLKVMAADALLKELEK